LGSIGFDCVVFAQIAFFGEHAAISDGKTGILFLLSHKSSPLKIEMR
jgi:hypothetical protein